MIQLRGFSYCDMRYLTHREPNRFKASMAAGLA